MAAVTPSYPNVNATRDTALTLYTGEVIKAFREKNIGLSLVKKRMITGGKSAQFIITGKADAADIQAHTSGAEVTTNQLANNEVTITVSQRYVHGHFLDGLDVRIAQYDASSELAFQSGEVLATKVDKDIFSEFAAAAVIVIGVTRPGQVAAGINVLTGYAAATSAGARGDLIATGMFEAQTALNVKNVTEAATFVTSPKGYYELVQSGSINKDYTFGNNGGVDTGHIAQVAGIPVIWTNHLDLVTDTKLVGYVTTKDVIGVVSAMDITSEIFYDQRRLGSQYTSYYAMGFGVLNPTGLEVLRDDSI